MNGDPYRRVAGLYDRLFEPINHGLRVLGIRLFVPPRGGAVLDIGCGTGIHLEMYQRFGCHLYGIDTSPAMLEMARARLGQSADLRLGDATEMPFQTAFFDLAICMLALHEMDQQQRFDVLREIKRVTKGDGRILLIDFHTGRPRPFKGWWSKIIILASEVAAGRRHFANYRHFMSIGGLPYLVEQLHLSVDKERVVGDNTLALYLLRSN